MSGKNKKPEEADSSKASDYSDLLVCENTTCRFYRGAIDCEMFHFVEECDNREILEIPESPWHKDFPNSTQELRTKWDIENRTH